MNLVTGQQATEDTYAAAQEQETGGKQQQGSLDDRRRDLSNLSKDSSGDLAKRRNQSSHSSSSLQKTSFLKNNEQKRTIKTGRVLTKNLVAGAGIEPTPSAAKADVLPLDDPALSLNHIKNMKHTIKDPQCKKGRNHIAGNIQIENRFKPGEKERHNFSNTGKHITCPQST